MTKSLTCLMTTDTALPWRKGSFLGVTLVSMSLRFTATWPREGHPGVCELSQVDSSRERLLEVRVSDADLYSRSNMLHMLFLHLANGAAVIITILSVRKSYCLIVLLPKLFVSFLLGELCELQVWRSCGLWLQCRIMWLDSCRSQCPFMCKWLRHWRHWDY